MGALAVRIQADLGVSPAQIGAAVSVFTTTAAVGSIHGGRWIERIG